MPLVEAVLAKMMPQSAKLDFGNCLRINTKPDGEISLQDLATQGSDFSHITLREVRSRMIHAHDDRRMIKASLNCVEHILALSDPLQIINLIVQFVSILVVNLHPHPRRQTQERERNESAHPSVFDGAWALKSNFGITLPGNFGPQYKGHPNTGKWIDASHTTLFRHLIPTLPFSNWAPLFFHSINPKAIIA